MMSAGKVAHLTISLKNCGRSLGLFGLALCIVGCASAPAERYLELTYVDFGPQAMAYPLLGQNRLGYLPHAPMGLGLGEVRVIVYRPPATAEAAAARYPPDPLSQLDFRYLTAADALSYLDQRIQQNLLGRITERLHRTRQRIERWLQQ